MGSAVLRADMSLGDAESHLESALEALDLVFDVLLRQHPDDTTSARVQTLTEDARVRASSALLSVRSALSHEGWRECVHDEEDYQDRLEAAADAASY